MPHDDLFDPVELCSGRHTHRHEPAVKPDGLQNGYSSHRRVEAPYARIYADGQRNTSTGHPQRPLFIFINEGVDQQDDGDASNPKGLGHRHETKDDTRQDEIWRLGFPLVFDEEEQILIVPQEGNVTTLIEVDVSIFPIGDPDNEIINFSQAYNNTNEALVCIANDTLNGTSYRMDVQTRYDSNLYAAEFHNIQNFTLTNETIPQEITLYDLNLSDTTEFLITFENEQFLPVEDALLLIQRKYVGEGVFKTVEIPKTDSGKKKRMSLRGKFN